MRFLFTTRLPYLPDVIGGAERSVDELIRGLVARGHDCEVVAGVRGRRGRLAYRFWRSLPRDGLGRPDGRNGYPTFRGPPELVPPILEERLRRHRPHLLVPWGLGAEDAAARALAASVPALVWIHDVVQAGESDRLPRSPRVVRGACSRFVAERLADPAASRVVVLRPPIDLARYRAAWRSPRYITLVNPMAPKGLDVALQVARLLPHRELLFVESYPLTRGARAALAAAVRPLRNVTLRRPTLDMGSVYARTRLLFVPSQVEDAAPRVVLEAQANGIPVVASRIGGIPEVLGDGGVLCPPSSPASVWAAAIEETLASAERFARLAGAARANAARPELGRDAITETFIATARELAEGWG
jgi:glycosyltransferase involved in cell wall biosynthesis